MGQQLTEQWTELYELDETAWLEAMAQLIHEGRYHDLDYPHLAEFLTDMARRDKREVLSCLSVLISHWLKWTYQPERRSNNWRATIEVQRQELNEMVTSGTLRNYAMEVLSKAYANGVRQAVAETGLTEEAFPEECPNSLDEILAADLSTN